jgi:hypothetical protein
LNSNVNVKGNLALAPGDADGKLANVGFAAMQKPKFYRERAQAPRIWRNIGSKRTIPGTIRALPQFVILLRDSSDLGSRRHNRAREQSD